MARVDRIQVNDDKVGQEEWMPTDKVVLPLVLSLVIALGFLLVGMYLFSWWEDWDLAEAGYFCFITMTTIG